MFNFMEELIVYIILASAAFYVIRKTMVMFRGKAACNGCPKQNTKELSLDKSCCGGCPILKTTNRDES